MSRPALSLQTRLLAGLAAVAVVLVAIAWVVTATTRDHLVDQVDAQLVAASDADRNGRFRDPAGAPAPPAPAPADGLAPTRPERLSAMFEGAMDPDGTLEVFFEPNLPGQDFSIPELDGDEVAASIGIPFTAEGVDGDVTYRVLAVPAGDGQFIRALPLADVDATIGQLVRYEIAGLLAILAVLAAVAWWVIRLGIRPLKAMTRAAAEIGDDDLSARIPDQAAAGTEAGQLAGALNTMLGRIEAAVEAQRRTEERLRRFVADASHELRTPVTTIRGYAELYHHGGLRDADELDDAMRRTAAEAQRMGRLVDDMLTLAKLDQQPPNRRTSVDLTGLVTDTVADARVTAPDHPLTATIEPDVVVDGDEDQLKQVVVNILGNATIHTPTGTPIGVTVRRDGADAIVEVADGGPGIDADDLSRLTERFYRADPSRSRAGGASAGASGGGSGLGLAIAESAIDANGGTIDITSEPGLGTTVTLRLPAAP